MNVDGQWTVDVNDEINEVVIGFDHTDEDGVESFVTSMPPRDALAFAVAVIKNSMELLDE